MALDTLTSDRARRALSHGQGIDGILLSLIAVAGVGVVIFLLVAGLQTAETRATRSANVNHQISAENQSSEIGTN